MVNAGVYHGHGGVIYASICKRGAVFSWSFFLIVYVQASEAAQMWHARKGRNMGVCLCVCDSKP